MENNLENNIKKHFHNREITPNPALWNLLEAKLETQKEQTNKNKYKWLAYASIFIGILFALAVFFNSDKKVKQENFITQEKEVPVIEKPVKHQEIPLLKNQNENFAQNKSKVVRKQKASIKPNWIAQKTTRIKEKTSIDLDASDTEKPIRVKQNNYAKQNEKEALKLPKRRIKTLSDEDLNALLATRLTKINQKDTASKKIRIKTNQVLYSLENEMNTSLKNKIIKTLVAGAQAVDNHISNN